METKSCFKCGEVKPLTEFYKHPQMSDGRVNKCKECNKRDVQENRRKRIDYYKEYEKGRAMLPHRVEARKSYIETEAGKNSLRRSTARYRRENPVKYGAHVVVANAVRAGKLVQGNECEECGADDVIIHAHHDDYAKPLCVRWLCPSCHKAWHDENGPGENG